MITLLTLGLLAILVLIALWCQSQKEIKECRKELHRICEWFPEIENPNREADNEMHATLWTVIAAVRYNGFLPHSDGNSVHFSAFEQRFSIRQYEESLSIECTYNMPEANVDQERLKQAARSRWIGGLNIGPTQGSERLYVRFSYVFDEHDKGLFALREAIPKMALYISEAIDSMINNYYGNKRL